MGFRLVFAIGAIFSLIGCSSTAVSVKEQVRLPRTIKVAPIVGEPAQHSEKFLQPLRERGFRFGESDDPRAAILVVGFDPNVFNTEFDVALIHEGKILLNSKATNNGWGTGIARAQAIETLSDKVRDGIRAELNKMNVIIIDDRTLTETACAGMFEDVRLIAISNKVQLSPDKAANFSMLTNQDLPNESERSAIFVWADLQKQCLDKEINSSIQSGNDAKIDGLLNIFNARQALLADLANGKQNFGEFAKRANELLVQVSKSKQERESALLQTRDREKDRGIAITNQTQQSFQSNINTFKPNFTQCNRIGNQVFCNSY